MKGYIDLHCHWISGVDDGARSQEEGVEMLRRLYQAGFSHVVATPHMRPGMFETEKKLLQDAFSAMLPLLPESGVPTVGLSSEHHFDDIVFERLVRGEGLPYEALDRKTWGQPTLPAKNRRTSVLIEFPQASFPSRVDARMYNLTRAGLRPVLAHPERYRPVWKDDECLTPLLEAGVAMLLDVCAIVGKYGSASQEAAEKLLEDGAYEAACTDSHRPEDADISAKAIERLREIAGEEECLRLLRDGPLGILGVA